MSELSKPLSEKPKPPELWAAIAIIAGIFALGSALYFPGFSKRWEIAETALSKWQATPGRIDHVARRHKKRFYEAYSGHYHFGGDVHRFRTAEFEDHEFPRALGYTLRNNSSVIMHVNPANPSESVFEASAQREIFRVKTKNAGFLAVSCGLLSVIGIALQIYDRRRFHRKARV